MAAALSRALKLPGKKGSELGEYDPLTQADSEDDSEEDDLVLNYPRNGLGRDACLGSSKPRGGRSGRLVTAGDDAPDEEDEWREQLPSKSRQDLDPPKSWGQTSDDRSRDRRGSGSSSGREAEEKRRRTRKVVRTLCFMVPLVCAGSLVLLCAFLIPCRSGDLATRGQWERALGEAGGVTPPALTLWDVDGDSVDDVILGVTEWTNGTRTTPATKIYSAVALSSARGHVLWRKNVRELLMYVQCGLQPLSSPPPVCLLVGKSSITAVNGTTGKTLWFNVLKNIESQAVLLPDVQGDLVPDLLLATLPADETLDLSLTLVSGLTGDKIGRSVPFNLTGQGKLVEPLLHETETGSFYVLFGLGNVEAVSLQDVYTRATGKLPVDARLRRKDPRWEEMRKSNSSSLIHIYRGSDPVDFLLPLVAGFGNNHNSLDPLYNQNTSRSDWVLVYGSSIVSLVRQQDLHKQWTFSSPPIHSQPVPGHFNDDGVLDLLVQRSANGVMKALVIDGASSEVLWSEDFVCPRLVLEPSAVFSSSGRSAFLFWAGDPIRAQRNTSRPTVSPAPAPLIRKLFLLHPTFPTILLELNSTTDTAITSAVSYQPSQSDAAYISVSSRPTVDSEPGTRIIKSIRLRAALGRARLVRLGDGTGPDKPGTFEVNKFFRRLTFTRP